MPRPAECREECRDKRGVIDRRAGCGLKVPLKEARSDPAPTLRLLTADQRGEQKQLFSRWSADLAQSRLGDQEVPTLQCATENGSWVPLGGDLSRFLSWGRRPASLPRLSALDPGSMVVPRYRLN